MSSEKIQSMTSKTTRNVFRASIWRSISHLYDTRLSGGKVEIFNTLIRMYFIGRDTQSVLNEKVSYQRVCELFAPTRRMNKREAKRYWGMKENLFDFTTLTRRLFIARSNEWKLHKYLHKKLTDIFWMCSRKGYDVGQLEKVLTRFFKLVNGKGIRKAFITGHFSMKIVNNCGVFVLKEEQLPEKFSFQEVCGCFFEDTGLSLDTYRRMFLTKFFPDFVKI